MKINNRKKIEVFLIILIIFGSFNLIKSKASTVLKSDCSNEIKEDINYSEILDNTYIQQLRKTRDSISITTIEDLYNEFDKYEYIDEKIRESVLSKTSDKVIITFLAEEQKNIFEEGIESGILDSSLNVLEYNNTLEEDSYLKSIDIKNYKKGSDSYKKVTTILSKYHGLFEIIIVDEPEEDNITRQDYKLVYDANDSEGQYKDYGNRKFSVEYKCFASIIKAIYHYEIIGGGLNFRYIEGEAQNVIKPLEKISVVDTYDQSITSREIGKNIMSTVTFQLKAATPIFGGFDMGKYRIEMSVKQGKEIQHPSKTGMMVYQRAKVYAANC